MILQVEEGKGIFFKTQFSVISESRPRPPVGNGGSRLGWLPALQQQPRAGSAGMDAVEERGLKSATQRGAAVVGAGGAGRRAGQGGAPTAALLP